MRYLIGTDEAGYGPNLGPLVVSATLWQVPRNVRAGDLYQRLANVISTRPGRAGRNPAKRVAMADSKILYQPGKGLRHLERGLWVAMSLVDQDPDSWSEIWHALAPESVAELQTIPWYADYDSPVPLDVDPAEIQPLAAAVRKELAAQDIWLIDILSRAVFPEQFNRLVKHYGSKGSALSHLTLELVSRAMHLLDGDAISIVCDKHGGRNRYRPLLAEHFPDHLIEIRGEGRKQSVYRFGPPHRRVEICFQAKAESHLPTALASMASKYLRELAMRAINDYWCDRVAGLQPTAGYPQDAKRFKKAIAGVQSELGIDEQVLWRVK